MGCLDHSADRMVYRHVHIILSNIAITIVILVNTLLESMAA